MIVKPVGAPTAVADLIHVPGFGREKPAQPILITGATGTLGSAFARMCERRHLAYRIVSRAEMDVTDHASIKAAIARHRPWAIINAAGYVKVDQAEVDVNRCRRENTLCPTLLALACIRDKVRFVTFSSDLVFDGKTDRPYIESDLVAPLGVYGRSKVDAERCVLDTDPDALVIRTSAFFGPWDRHNFISKALDALDNGHLFAAASDVTISPTYVPDLVHACLDLLIDKEKGIWHLTNETPVTWSELALMAARTAGVDVSNFEERPAAKLASGTLRPSYSALQSERGRLLPPLSSALERYVALRADPSRYIAARSNQ